MSSEFEGLIRDQRIALDASSIIGETDADGKIIYVNERFCKVSGYSREELIGSNHRILKSGFHGQGFYKNMWATIHSGQIWHGTIKNRAKGGTYYWVDTTIIPFCDVDGKIYKFVSVRHEVTAIKELEENLRQQVAVATTALAASAAKSSFISELSHEIRGVLGCVLGFSNLLKETKTSGDQTHYVNRISKSIQYTLDLMSDVLEASKLKATSVQLNNQIFSLSNTIQLVWEMVQAQGQSKGLSMKLEIDKKIPDRLVGDPQRLSQVVLNLLINSIKFTDRGSIALRCQLLGTPEDPNLRLGIYVTDTGRGLAESEKAILFQEFSQCRLKDSAAGTGLGLSISKSLVELMGGHLDVLSKIDCGSTFSFEIPIVPTPDLSINPHERKVLPTIGIPPSTPRNIH
jgi:two-component system sensor histidine kinase/response regulator